MIDVNMLYKFHLICVVICISKERSCKLFKKDPNKCRSDPHQWLSPMVPVVYQKKILCSKNWDENRKSLFPSGGQGG